MSLLITAIMGAALFLAIQEALMRWLPPIPGHFHSTINRQRSLTRLLLAVGIYCGILFVLGAADLALKILIYLYSL